MRDFKSMKRQRGRNRKPGGGGGGGNNPNRAFDSNGPEGVKVRGNAQHVYERYQQLARDAASSGDRVLAENFLQHAEHYFRLIRAMQPNRPVSEIVSRDSFASGFDIDFEDESGVPQVDSEATDGEGGEGESQSRDGQGGDQREFRRDRDNRDRGEFRRDRDRDGEGNRDRDNRDRDGNRDRGEFRRDRDDRQRDDRNRDDRPRDDRPRDDRAEGEGGGRRESRRERFERQRAERRARFNEENAEAAPQAADQGGQAGAEQPREPQPVLRSEDGGESHMPAFLGRAAPAAAPEAEASGGDEPAPVKKPRAPRRKKSEEPAGEDA